MITAEAETSEKFPKGAIKPIFPKIFKSVQRKASENLMGKILGGQLLRCPRLQLGAVSLAAPHAAVAVPQACHPVRAACTLVPGWDLPGSVGPAAGFRAGER